MRVCVVQVLFGTGVVSSAVLTGAQTGLWQVAAVWGFGVSLAIYCTASKVLGVLLHCLQCDTVACHSRILTALPSPGDGDNTGVSGAHLNPAVTLSYALLRPTEFPLYKMAPFMLAQLIGGFIG